MATPCGTPTRGWASDGAAWITCPCGWYAHGILTMRGARRQHKLHRYGLDPS